MKSVAGIDVSKQTLDLFFNGKSYGFANSKLGYSQIAKLCKNADLIVMEATGRFHFPLACYLSQAGLCVAVANPARPCYYARSMGKRNKTDKVDAKVLAEFGRAQELLPFQVPSQAQLELTSLVRLRCALVDQRATSRCKAKDFCLGEFEQTLLKEQEAFFELQIQAVEAQLEGLIKSQEKLCETFALLLSIPGIAKISAWSLMGELGDVRRFENAKKLAAFAGVCPSLRESGTSLKGAAKMSRQGNRQVRRTLFMAALSASRDGGTFQAFYQKLLKAHKAKKAALVAVMHKLIRTAYGILKTKQPFKQQYEPLTNSN